MKLDRKELVEILKFLKPGLTEKAIIEHTDHIIFIDDYLITYNDTIAGVYPLQTGIMGAVSAKEFFEIVSKMSSKKITLKGL